MTLKFHLIDSFYRPVNTVNKSSVERTYEVLNVDYVVKT